MFVETSTILIRLPIDKITYARELCFFVYSKNKCYNIVIFIVYLNGEMAMEYGHYFLKFPLYCLRGNLFRVYIILKETLGVERAFSVFF